MRLDVFLKRTGLFKQRVLARLACDQGALTVDGRPARAARQVEPGRVIRLRTDSEDLEMEIIGLPGRSYRRKDGEAFYRIRSRRARERFEA